jgi:DNA invertase Pin-like site-specific DNA recombinase
MMGNNDTLGTLIVMDLGYGRVSTRDQNLGSQRDRLTAAGCERVYVDWAAR